jgi:hypothetical protein
MESCEQAFLLHIMSAASIDKVNLAALDMQPVLHLIQMGTTPSNVLHPMVAVAFAPPNKRSNDSASEGNPSQRPKLKGEGNKPKTQRLYADCPHPNAPTKVHQAINKLLRTEPSINIVVNGKAVEACMKFYMIGKCEYGPCQRAHQLPSTAEKALLQSWADKLTVE